MMSVEVQHPFERAAALAPAAVKIFQGPGQKQTGTAGHALPPSNPTCAGAAGRLERKPLFLSRPTFHSPATRKFTHYVRRISFV